MSTSPQGALRLLLEKPMGLPQSRAGMLPDGDSQKEKRKFGKVPVVAQLMPRMVGAAPACAQAKEVPPAWLAKPSPWGGKRKGG